MLWGERVVLHLHEFFARRALFHEQDDVEVQRRIVVDLGIGVKERQEMFSGIMLGIVLVSLYDKICVDAPGLTFLLIVRKPYSEAGALQGICSSSVST